jgi:hypothetical protein
MTNMTGSKLSIFSHPGKITYHLETHILALDCVSGQYGSRDDNQANIEMSMY